MVGTAHSVDIVESIRDEHNIENSQSTSTPLERHEILLKGIKDTFSLEENERGETHVLEMDIITENVSPKKTRARRIPLSLYQEVARQLEVMQDSGVIQPSNSPWASPTVLVRKKTDLIVDYHSLNSVTKLDR